MVEELRSVVALATALVDARTLADSHAPFPQLCIALDQVEQLLFYHKDAFGIQSTRFQLGCEEFVLLNNTFAMCALQQQQYSSQQELQVCGDLLSRAEQHTRRSGYLRSIPQVNHVTRRRAFRLVSLNNLACYHKEAGKPLAALRFLEKALHIQRQQTEANATLYGDEVNADGGAIVTEQDAEYAIALTHLNLCAVLAQLDRHAAAAQHARSAIALLDVQNDGKQDRVDQVSRAHFNLVLIAHFNLAVELEHLSDGVQAQRMYETALALARARGITRDDSELANAIEAILWGRQTQATAASRRNHMAVSPRGRLLRPQSPHSIRQATATLAATSARFK
uniref:MalT-like TPR region domain-containing protein n=1 Tax=Globisporangium ultimum (strain ATCC 200006 / CBS 805.95 / DAOM BR144) TaxID=431595 RepID=K3WFF7_GLOUD